MVHVMFFFFFPFLPKGLERGKSGIGVQSPRKKRVLEVLGEGVRLVGMRGRGCIAHFFEEGKKGERVVQRRCGV